LLARDAPCFDLLQPSMKGFFISISAAAANVMFPFIGKSKNVEK